MSAHPRIRTLSTLAFVVAVSLAGRSSSQVREPEPPKRYDATIRYLITSKSDQRIRDYQRMSQLLIEAGLVRNDDHQPEEIDDPEVTTITGTIPPGRDVQLLRIPFLRGVLLKPAGVAVPADGKQLLTVEIWTKPSESWRWRERLQRLVADGFQESFGYDNKSRTRLVGRIPAGKLGNLLPPQKFADLRNSPHVGIVKYFPDPAGLEPTRYDPQPEKPLPPDKAHLMKVSPELRVKGDAKDQSASIRLEVIVAEPEMATDPAHLRELTRAADSPGVEYTLGPIVALPAGRSTVEEIAKLDFVQAVRMPRPATASVANAPVEAKGAPDLSGWSMERLRQLKARGQGVQVAVISDDFRGWEKLVGKSLPQGTRLLDLTAERDPNLLPENSTLKKADTVGEGTAQALAVVHAAPNCGLVLIRIDRAAPYQLVEVARHLRGRPVRSPALLQRGREIASDETRLQAEQGRLAALRRAAIEIAPDEPDPELQKVRQDYLSRRKIVDAEVHAYTERRGRYFDLLEALSALSKVQVVVCGLVWNDGYPLTGAGELAQELAITEPCTHVWIQAAGDTARQAWSGVFTDGHDGLVELVPPSTPIAQGHWSRRMNFLAWQPHDKEEVLELPAGVTVRLSVQWREAYDPLLRRLREPAYYSPANSFGFVVLRQRDPDAKNLPTDSMALVKRSPAREARSAQRLHLSLNQAVYEHSVEFKTDVSGRYAVLLEGDLHNSLRPRGDETIPAAARYGEVRPRVFVQTVTQDAKVNGRPVWSDFPGPKQPAVEGSFGTPADAPQVLVVGASQGQQRRPYSPVGSPLGMGLRRRPELLLPDGPSATSRTGSAVSAGYAGGVAASALSAGVGVEFLNRALRGREQQGWVISPNDRGR